MFTLVVTEIWRLKRLHKSSKIDYLHIINSKEISKK